MSWRRATALATVVVTVGAAACDGKGFPLKRRGAGSTGPVDSLALLRTENEYLRVASAERDTLLLQVRETQQFIDSVDVDVTRLAGADTSISVQVQTEGRDPQAQMRATMRRRLLGISDRIARSEAQARYRAERLRVLASKNEALGARVAELDSAVARFKEITQAQQTRIEELVQRVDSLSRENATLVAERGMLADSVQRLVARGDSVFVVAGTRAELLKAGVVAQEGGTKLPLFGSVGRALVPARAQNETPFSVLDRRRDLTIPLPQAGHAYRIVSAHDPALLEPAQPNNPVVRGAVHIRDPQRFWSQSRFLVLVDEGR
jgi:cell division protein FtsB